MVLGDKPQVSWKRGPIVRELLCPLECPGSCVCCVEGFSPLQGDSGWNPAGSHHCFPSFALLSVVHPLETSLRLLRHIQA